MEQVEKKVGKLVRETFFEKFKNLSDSEIENLMNSEYSKEIFDMDYSVLKEYRDDEDSLDERGKMRYFSPKNLILEKNDREYLLANHWFKRQKPLFKKWAERIS